MTTYDNTNRGVLFKNNNKKEETHSDYNGTININGKDHYLNAWIKEGKGGKFFSLSIGKEKGQSNSAGKEKFEPKNDKFFDDEIPF
jgi:hypothetical protein